MLQAGKVVVDESRPKKGRSERHQRHGFGMSALIWVLVALAIVSVISLREDRASASPVSDTLSTGQSLSAGQGLVSANGTYSAVVQGDGNLVVYGPGSQVLFATRTFALGASLVMQTDGNLVVYAAGHALFATGSRGSGADLVLQDDGNAVVYSSGRALWSSNGGLVPPPLVPVTVVSAGSSLSVGQALVSPDGRYYGVMQGDGNFVVYGPGSQVLFMTRTFGAGASLAMQTDGNLVLYVAGRALFATGSRGSNAYMVVQNDGNAVVYSSGRALWSSYGGLVPPPLVPVTVVSAGSSLSVGQALVSPDGQYYGVVQGDGNFVVYGPGSQVLFMTRTFGAGASLAMQTDGNLVLYVAGRVLFASGSRGSNAYLVVQNDGNAAVYSNGRALWSSHAGLIAVPSFGGSGDYRVGVDISPGTYRTRASQSGCYWERESVYGNSDDIIANNETNTTNVVTIKASDAGFYSDGCGTWTQDLSPLTISQTAGFGDGTWIVGTDVAAGTWTAPGGSGTGCYWARVSTFSGELNDIVYNHFSISGTTAVTILGSDAGFESDGCGNWTKVG